MICPLTGPLDNSNCPSFGMRSCITPLPSISSNILSVIPHNGTTTLLPRRRKGPHNLHYTKNTGKCGPTPKECQTLILAPCVSLFTSTGAICGRYNFDKYNISPKTLLFVMANCVCAYKYFLLNAVYRELSYLNWISSRMKCWISSRMKHLHLHKFYHIWSWSVGKMYSKPIFYHAYVLIIIHIYLLAAYVTHGWPI